MKENKCMSCQHVSCGAAKWVNGSPKGRKYSCDKDVTTDSTDGIIRMYECEQYEKHPNQRNLGHYLLCLRVDK